MPDGAYVFEYADDVAAIIVVRNIEEAKRKVTQMIRTKSRLEDQGLKLATEKTELIFLTKKCIPLEIDITTCDTTLTTWKVVNYFGIQLD